MYNFTLKDAHNFTDLHLNKYDNKLYPGNITEKLVKHTGNIIITDPLECVYCNKVFTSRNQLFRHLGYCDVDIRDKKKYKQTKITKYMVSCSDYDADTEEENQKLNSDIDSLISKLGNLNTKSKVKSKFGKIMKHKKNKKNNKNNKKNNLLAIFKKCKIS
tara:strand:- start:4394 stop:4873 length:480 start_codon:yes stop_codon:yes gene_type:complete